MKLELYQYVALCQDIPEQHLKHGDVAMLIDYVTHSGNGEDGYILEVFNAVGDSIAVSTVPMSAVVLRRKRRKEKKEAPKLMR